MKAGVIGAGRIGGNAARLLAAAGHEVMLSFSRDQAKLARTAEQIGARAGAPGEAAGFGEVIVFSVPWPVIGEALAQAGSLRGKIVIDTTNQFAAGGIAPVPAGTTAAQFNQARMPGARLVKALNT